MSNLYLPKAVKISENVLFQEIEGECVLLNMESEQYFGLDEVGARMWQILAQGGDPLKVLTQMQLEYETDEETLRKDLSNLLEELKNEDLIAVEN